MDNRTCSTCSATFAPRHSRQIYCASKCRPRPRVLIEKACDCCGATCIKERRKQRYRGTYCGTLCRDFAKYGPTACELSPSHWGRWYGASSEWAAPLIRNTGECDWCGGPNNRGRQAQYCTPKCKGKAKRQRRRAAEFNAPGEYKYSDVIHQYIAQGRTCAYCLVPSPTAPEPDHVIALSRGGRNDMTNIVASCSACNADKRELSLSEWQADRARRKLSAVNINLTGARFPRLIMDSETSNIHSLAA